MSDFATELERQLRWREAELASLKRFAISSRENSVAYHAALRALWALLYAHYEGFAKFCWDLALDETQRAAVKRAELLDCVAALSLEEFFSAVRGNTSTDALWKVFRKELPVMLEESAHFPQNHRLKTDSNLWPAMFRERTARLGIRCEELDAHETRLKTLVARRNEIAHGEAMIIGSLDEYAAYERAVQMIMHELAVKVLDYIERAEYRVPPQVPVA